MSRRLTWLRERRGGREGRRVELEYAVGSGNWSLIPMRVLIALLLGISLGGVLGTAQTPARKKHILVVGQTKGFQHDSVSDAMGSVWKMGMGSDLWTTYMRTDTGLITKAKLTA